MGDKSRSFSFIIPPTVHVPVPGTEYVVSAPLEGVSILAQLISSGGFDVQIFDLRRLSEGFREAIWTAFDVAEYIGVSTSIDSFRFLEEFCLVKKKFYPDSVLIVGGNLATAAPGTLMESLPEVDYVFQGEAEESLLSLLLRDKADSPGVWSRRENMIKSVAHGIVLFRNCLYTRTVE